MAIQGGRPNNRQVVPYLMVRDARAALSFYQKAFGAKIIYQAPMPGMTGMFAQFKIGESFLQLTDLPGYDPKGPRSPETLGGTSVVLEMYVDDVDKSFANAVQLGLLRYSRRRTCSLGIAIPGWAIRGAMSGRWPQ